MGALIRTKGTKLLAAHLSEEFDTYIDFYRNAAIASQFDSSSAGYTSLFHLTLTITDAADHVHAPRGDHLTLLPNLHSGPHHKHGNLEGRWRWFLDTGNAIAGFDALTLSNDRQIAQYIYTALTQTSGGAYVYSSIIFDAVEHGGPQIAVQSDLWDQGILSSQIVLKTNRPMPIGPIGGTGQPPPID